MRIAGRWMGALAPVGLAVVSLSAAQAAPPPIIDMHMHAPRADSQGPPPLGLCPGDVSPPSGAWPPMGRHVHGVDEEAALRQSDLVADDRPRGHGSKLAVMKRRNVFGVVSGVLLDDWRQAAPERVIPSLDLNFDPPFRAVDDVRKALTSGGYRALRGSGHPVSGRRTWRRAIRTVPRHRRGAGHSGLHPRRNGPARRRLSRVSELPWPATQPAARSRRR